MKWPGRPRCPAGSSDRSHAKQHPSAAKKHPVRIRHSTVAHAREPDGSECTVMRETAKETPGDDDIVEVVGTRNPDGVLTPELTCHRPAAKMPSDAASIATASTSLTSGSHGSSFPNLAVSPMQTSKTSKSPGLRTLVKNTMKGVKAHMTKQTNGLRKDLHRETESVKEAV